MRLSSISSLYLPFIINPRDLLSVFLRSNSLGNKVGDDVTQSPGAPDGTVAGKEGISVLGEFKIDVSTDQALLAASAAADDLAHGIQDITFPLTNAFMIATGVRAFHVIVPP